MCTTASSGDRWRMVAKVTKVKSGGLGDAASAIAKGIIQRRSRGTSDPVT
jgi:hypothetical protein